MVPRSISMPSLSQTATVQYQRVIGRAYAQGAGLSLSQRIGLCK